MLNRKSRNNMGFKKLVKNLMNMRKDKNMKRSYIHKDDLRYNPPHVRTVEVTKYDIEPYNMVTMVTRGIGYFVRSEYCHIYKTGNTTCYDLVLEKQYAGTFVDVIMNYENHEDGEGKIINICMIYENDLSKFIENVTRDEAIKFMSEFFQKTLLL